MKIVLIIASALVAGYAYAQALPAGVGRYMTVAEGGTVGGAVWRLDTTTGTMWRCTAHDGLLGCQKAGEK
jgi:hypothetical protein